MSPIEKSGLKIERVLYDFLVDEALPGSGISETSFFDGLAPSSASTRRATAICSPPATRSRPSSMPTISSTA